MKIKPGRNAYGKNAINLSKIIRHKDYHEFRQVSVSISLQGDYDSAHTAGDNSKILPTDTQKNTVYALAKENFTASAEEFGLFLADYFVKNNSDTVTQCRVAIDEYAWSRMMCNGKPHPHAYISSGPEIHTVVIVRDAAGMHITSGIKDLLILKTTDSGFENYIRDQFTTLKETSDRIFATQCEANWIYSSYDLDFTFLYQDIRTSLLQTFANHKSLSVQHTLYAMGEEVLKKYEAVKEISFIMPNRHHILFNLEQFGMSNANEIFIATEEPYGYITGTVTRE